MKPGVRASAVGVGFAFGFLLSAGGLGDVDRVREALVLDDLTLYLVPLSALAVAAVGVALLRRRGRTRYAGPLVLPDGRPASRHVYGATLFGVGVAVTASSPALSVAQVSDGQAYGLVVLLGLLLVADRVGAAVASSAIAAEVQSSSRLTAEPDVDIAGFPFLTQVIAGRYERVEVAARGVPAGELTLDRLDATLTGVQVSLADALSGSVRSVPVEGVQARALVPYAELARRSGDRRLAVAPSGERVRVTGSVQVLGQTLTAVAVSRVEVVEGDLRVTAEEYEVGNTTADRLVSRALGDRLDLRIPVTGLPYGLQVAGVEVEADGVAVVARTSDTVLSPG